MRVPVPCPGRCNQTWRDAESLGEPHDIPSTWGDPLWCHDCTQRFATAVADFPRLVVAIHQQALHGTPVASVSTIRSTPKAVHAWPGQQARLLTEEIHEALTSLEDDVRQHCRLRLRVQQKREGTAISAAAHFILRQREWVLTHHPIADDPEDAPAAYLLRLHAQAVRFAGEGLPKPDRKPTPCPGCGWTTLFQQDGGDYIECTTCGRLLTANEYREHTVEQAAEQHRLLAS